MNINLSKEKQERLLRQVSKVKEFIVKNSKDSLIIQYILEIEQELNNKNYGLIFEKHLEPFERMNSKDYHDLSEVKELYINGGGIEHLLIECENLIALTLLKKNYRERMNVICIDPPYNTGNWNLKYNDYDYTDSNDKYSHSKWLSFMEKRLTIAKELLVSNGVMFINIDETQIGCLILLCESIFGEQNVDVLIWPKIDPRFDKNRIEKPVFNVKFAHEYIILCYKNKDITLFNKMMRIPNHRDIEAVEQPYFMETILHGLGTTSSAKDELQEIFGNRDIFSTPKPLKMIKEFVRVAAGKEAIVFDFFAGSGTTGHAVMDLNEEDGGKREFILVTNNENNICREILHRRLKKAISKEGYRASIKYLKY